ncbi:MAG TPA: alkaline phosphatase family protein [Candidatus Dormibacteraeota bacterium]|jgi:phospholipase C|nr:alkaline phosphatase family protein [Candidatus Dormibacteraeota bacterium]
MATPKYVFTLMLENRSFDHMLGFSGITGTDANTGSPTQVDGLQPGANAGAFNEYRGRRCDAIGDARFCLPVGPTHNFADVYEQLVGPDQLPPTTSRLTYPDPTNTGFVANYTKEIAKHGSPQDADPCDAIKCFVSAQHLPVLHALASEFVVCDAWFSSMPGPTWPNRFFVHAASSGGLDHSPSALSMATSYRLRSFKFQNGHVFQRLEGKGIYWAVLSGSWLPQCFAMEGMHEFWDTDHRREMKDIDKLLDDVLTHDRAYVFIEPSYGDFLNDTYRGGTSQHALDDVTRGEWLLKAVYEKLRNHGVWDDCALIVTWDEHGGFWDHVPPPQAPPPGDATTNDDNEQFGFQFDRYGVRVPAVLVSPFTERNLVDHRVHDHSTVLSTLGALWDLGGPFTARDGRELHDGASLATVLSRDTPRSDCPQTLPDPAQSTGCPPDDDPPFTSVADVLGVPPDTIHTAQAANATPSDTSAGFAHVAHLVDVGGATPADSAQRAEAFTQSQTDTASVQTYLGAVQERLRPGETIRQS